MADEAGLHFIRMRRRAALVLYHVRPGVPGQERDVRRFRKIAHSWPGRVVHPPLKYWRKGARACSRAEKMAIAAFWVAYHYAVQAGHALLHYGRAASAGRATGFRPDGGRWRRAPSSDFPAAFSPERPPRHDPGLGGRRRNLAHILTFFVPPLVPVSV